MPILLCFNWVWVGLSMSLGISSKVGKSKFNSSTILPPNYRQRYCDYFQCLCLKSVRGPDILTIFWAKNHLYLRCDDLQCGRVRSELSCVNSKNHCPTKLATSEIRSATRNLPKNNKCTYLAIIHVWLRRVAMKLCFWWTTVLESSVLKLVMAMITMSMMSISTMILSMVSIIWVSIWIAYGH